MVLLVLQDGYGPHTLAALSAFALREYLLQCLHLYKLEREHQQKHHAAESERVQVGYGGSCNFSLPACVHRHFYLSVACTNCHLAASLVGDIITISIYDFERYKETYRCTGENELIFLMTAALLNGMLAARRLGLFVSAILQLDCPIDS